VGSGYGVHIRRMHPGCFLETLPRDHKFFPTPTLGIELYINAYACKVVSRIKLGTQYSGLLLPKNTTIINK